MPHRGTVSKTRIQSDAQWVWTHVKWPQKDANWETKQVDLFEADANMGKVGLYKELWETRKTSEQEWVMSAVWVLSEMTDNKKEKVSLTLLLLLQYPRRTEVVFNLFLCGSNVRFGSAGKPRTVWDLWELLLLPPAGRHRYHTWIYFILRQSFYSSRTRSALPLCFDDMFEFLVLFPFLKYVCNKKPSEIAKGEKKKQI